MSARAKLLVAAPNLADPNFRRTVVLVAEHSDEGAMGLVLNRPSDTTVQEAAPDLGVLADPSDYVHVGGPVQPKGVVVLAEFDEPEAAAAIVIADVGFVPARSDLASSGASSAARACSRGTPAGDRASSTPSWTTTDGSWSAAHSPTSSSPRTPSGCGAMSWSAREVVIRSSRGCPTTRA